MPAQQPPIIIERVLQVPPHTTVQMLVDGNVVQSLEVPPGSVQFYLRIAPRARPSIRHGGKHAG